MLNTIRTRRWVAPLGTVAVLSVLPTVLHNPYVLQVVSLALIFAVAALGLQLLLGFTGLVSLGQAAFLGIGAYTAGILAVQTKLPFVVGMIAAGAVSGVASLVLVPITRLRGVYLSVATLGFSIIVHLVLLNEEWLTGGSLGLPGIPRPTWGTAAGASETPLYLLCVAVMGIAWCALERLSASRFGRALQAIRLDEDAARSSGIDVTRYKSQAFVASAVVTGIAGALFAYHTQYLNPNDFSFWKSIEVLIMVAVGGIGSLGGAVAGAFFVTLLPQVLSDFADLQMIIFGSLLVLMMGFAPSGLASPAARAAHRIGEALRARRALRPREDA